MRLFLDKAGFSLAANFICSVYFIDPAIYLLVYLYLWIPIASFICRMIRGSWPLSPQLDEG